MSHIRIEASNAVEVFALQIAASREWFDVDAPDLEQQFVQAASVMPHLRAEVYWQTQKQEFVKRGWIEHVDGRLRVTDRVRDWLRMFGVAPDLTYRFFGASLSGTEWGSWQRAVKGLSEELQSLQQALQHFSGGHARMPSRLRALLGCVAFLTNLPALPWNDMTIDTMREAAVIACRERLLTQYRCKEQLEVVARDRDLLRGIETEIANLQKILAIPELASAVRTTPKPRITDFVNVGVVEKHTHGRPTDEKFGILTAPHQFSTDFNDTRDGAFARGRYFAVGFIDIDDFKAVNSKYKETVVDRDILPTFMRALEAYCYRRAYAYRQGGDEYLVLLHNANPEEARAFFEGLQAHLRDTPYPTGIESNPTVSIGVHVIDDIHEVTEFEAKRRANLAKDAAKKAGKDTGKGLIRFWADLTGEEQS